jgi:hypothetical protein
MLSTSVAPAPDGMEERTFECLKCHHVEIRSTQAAPLKTDAVGWLAGELGKQMTDYRAYTVGPDGHFIPSRTFICGNDADAIVWAKQLVDGHDVELWSGERMVIKLGQQQS